MTLSHKRLAAASLLAMLSMGAMSAAANAENLLDTKFGPAQSFTLPNSNAILFPSGSFFQSFFTAEAETVMISFSGVCSITGNGRKAVRIAIRVANTAAADEEILYPTSLPNFVLCSGNSTRTENDGRGTFSFISSINVKAGNHQVTMQVTPTTGARATISALSIQVWN